MKKNFLVRSSLMASIAAVICCAANTHAQSFSGPTGRGSATRTTDASCGGVEITQNTNTTTVAVGSIACSTQNPTVTSDNFYARNFSIANATNVKCVDFAVQSNTATPTNVRVRLYTHPTAGTPVTANMTMIAGSEVMVPIPASANLTFFSATYGGAGIAVPAGNLVVELFTACRQTTCVPPGDGGAIFIGSNSLGNSAPAYLKSAPCGLADYASVAAIGFPNMHLLIALGTSGSNPCSLPLIACRADVDPIGGGNGNVNVNDLLAVINTWGQTQVPPGTGPRPQGDCDPTPNGNCQVNVNDLLTVINAWGPCGAAATGACWLPNNTCVVNTQQQCNAAGGLGWVSGANCTDTDGDRIPNAYEQNTCTPAGFPFAGTNPNVPDTDGDLLRDGDEIYGTLGGVNLPAMGCNPLRKNMMLEVDWFDDADGGAHSHRPGVNAIAMIVGSFGNSTVTNVCGGTGITLIVDYGQGGPYTGGNLIPGGDTVVVFDTEYNTYKGANFAANRTGIFYYSIHCHRYNTAANGSSGIAEINGDDHIVSLQNFVTDVNVSRTMMHEFGHNLNLRHGGNVDTNFKPNYNSVMNYRFTFPGIDGGCDAVGDNILDYSRGLRITLNEQSLMEANGVCGGANPIDWNGGGISGAAISHNINCDVGFSTICGGSNVNCFDTVCTVITDFNDWANVVFTGLNEGDFAAPEIIMCDPPMFVAPLR